MEEPFYDADAPHLVVIEDQGVSVVVTHLPEGMESNEAERTQQALVTDLLESAGVRRPILWYYTPMALGWAPSVDPACSVYDCMDELSAFRDPPPELRPREKDLLRQADLVFTGGQSLFEAKRDQHDSVHCFPSSVDVQHFARARTGGEDPADQAPIAHPRLGFYGVLDERMDYDLVAEVAKARPDWQIIMVGPVSLKIDEADLPRQPNIHYLGAKTYGELPSYLAGWDLAILPFARNDSTRFISPTKTPEYLAAGRPVVSTSIRDVVRPYGERELVQIADAPGEFVDAVERALREHTTERQEAADEYLRDMSWDRTWARMEALIDHVLAESGSEPARTEQEALRV